jgi:hypothetical protein
VCCKEICNFTYCPGMREHIGRITGSILIQSSTQYVACLHRCGETLIMCVSKVYLSSKKESIVFQMCITTLRRK